MAPREPQRPPVADAELAAWLEGLGDGPRASETGVAAMRAASQARADARPRGPELVAVTDLPADGALVAMRLYRPSSAPRPLVVFLHGGAWVTGDLDSHDRTCRRLAAAADVCVLAVDIRRAPEHPWPAAVDDAVAAFRWAAGRPGALGAEGCRLGVAGDSSGGMVAALCCLRLRDGGGPLPDGQALAYPNTDLTFSRPSISELGAGFGLDARDLRWCAEQWVPDPALRPTGAVSPLHADRVDGLPRPSS